MRKKKPKIFYRPEMVYSNHGSTSRSPEKPRLFVEKLLKEKLLSEFDLDISFGMFNKHDFLLAHTERYVNAMFGGKKPLCESSGIEWSDDHLTSVRYTNASLYEAIRCAIHDPHVVTISPTSGFHHAKPSKGADYCTFAGQAISSIKIYNELGISGVYFDLDAHFGNSLEDCREFNPILNKAVPIGYNINPIGDSVDYIRDFYRCKSEIRSNIREDLISGKIGYVVWCHGADSHIWDDMGDGQLNTEYWIACARVFYSWMSGIDRERSKRGLGPVPLILSLFGGYRADDYDSVISLHVKDVSLCLNILYDRPIYYKERVRVPDHIYKLSKNEIEIMSFFDKKVNNIGVTGKELGWFVKKWKNHSMSKWADMLVKKGLLFKYDGGYFTEIP